MTNVLHEQTAQETHLPSTDHDCPYETYMRRKLTGGQALLSVFQQQKLSEIHAGGDCPPTHSSPTSPTRQWADLVQSSF